MKLTAILFYVFLTSCCFTYTLSGQASLIDVDKDRFYQVPSRIVKNHSLTVISDKSFEQSGLLLHEVGFRKNPYGESVELLIQFKADAGYKTTIGIHLFGDDRNEIWSDSLIRTDQPQERNLIPMIVRVPFSTLSQNAVLYIWAKTEVEKIPYEMWEWMDIGPTEWIVPTTDSLSEIRSLRKDTTKIYRENNITDKPVFNYMGQTALEYIQSNIIYPEKAKANQAEGLVMVTFVVTAEGVVRDAVLGFNIGYGCGQEVLRVVRSMPPWQPGLVDGKRVPVRVTRPVKFKL